jgi:hypothetical protein
MQFSANFALDAGFFAIAGNASDRVHPPIEGHIWNNQKTNE